MKICINNHTEIVFVGEECPLCEYIKKLAEVQLENGRLIEQSEALKQTVDDLREV